jgi:16S rRNA C967 or C1407 C5-methylase (RsmB/RsmF family)
VLRTENAELVRGFLAAHPGAADVTGSARLFPVGWPDGPGPGVALPTGAGGADGFYYACLERRCRG